MSRSAYPWASFFDFDKTLVKVNSSLGFTKFLVRKGQVSKIDFLLIVLFYGIYKLFPKVIPSLHRLAFKLVFKGKKLRVLEELAKEYWSRKLELLIDQNVYQAFKDAKAKGHLVVLLSNSPDFFVRIAAEILGFDICHGSSYQIVDGCFESVMSLVEGNKKADLVKRICADREISLTHTTAYTDCISDLPLLELVNEPVVINPSKQLKKICIQNGWRIILGN